MYILLPPNFPLVETAYLLPIKLRYTNKEPYPYIYSVLNGHLQLEFVRKRQVSAQQRGIMVTRYKHEINGYLQKLSTDERGPPNSVLCFTLEMIT